ncbi:thymidylate synthase [Leuconostoc litchii]|uniref:thymidylate synthase n=1 Tax=Leuconostoc litchii TaxID=1981069 RepID=A0A6P2CM25_9LACO|nr:thymidylate synthase [Leuconostoc litchii]TYC46634.1 thymidylate synthase [Leuconostoc litchii]GMA70499.1 thymidylate synthase [Leuconostoc litchii]
MKVYNNFNEAYVSILEEVYYHAEFFNQPRGFSSREKLGMNFKLNNPTQRIVLNSLRKTNIVFNIAEALWYLTGKNDLDFISYYNKRMPDYSMDNKTLTGTAYGTKIFNFNNQKTNQWQNVKEVLRQDPDSKRAVIQIFNADELMIKNNLDVSCTLALQFMIREKQLHMVAYMRANDAFRGIVSDTFSFTFMQEFMARELGIEVGNYYHQVGTMHIYEPDNQWAQHVMRQQDQTNFEQPIMPNGNNWPMLTELMKYEKMLRLNELTVDWQFIKNTGLSDYWRQILALFSIYQMIHYHKNIDIQLFKHLWPIYQYLLVNKWPTQLS